LAAQLVGHRLQAGQPRLLDLRQPRFVLLDHPLVMLGGDGGQPLRQEVVHGEAAFDFDHVALLAEVVHRLHQQELDAAMLAFGQSLETRALRAL
jgi:hypothetical protein